MPANYGHYTLDDEGNPVLCPDMEKWVALSDDIELRRVGKTTFTDGSEISTVFLGLDHRISPEGLPALFETLVQFNIGIDNIIRYATWEEALEGHLHQVELIRGGPGTPRIKKNNIREKPRAVERSTAWERLCSRDDF